MFMPRDTRRMQSGGPLKLGGWDELPEGVTSRLAPQSRNPAGAFFPPHFLKYCFIFSLFYIIHYPLVVSPMPVLSITQSASLS